MDRLRTIYVTQVEKSEHRFGDQLWALHVVFMDRIQIKFLRHRLFGRKSEQTVGPRRRNWCYSMSPRANRPAEEIISTCIKQNSVQ